MSDESYAVASEYTTPYKGGLWLNREDCRLIADLLETFVLDGGDDADNPLYDRADEFVRLCREVTAAKYVIGWNMIGYLPEHDPFEPTDVDSARAWMRDELDQDAEQSAEIGDDERIAECEAAIRDLETADIAQGWGAYIGNLHYWIAVVE